MASISVRDDIAHFDMSEFLGDSSVQSDKCLFTFPGDQGSRRNDVDDKIDIIMKRIEFLQDMVNSPSRNNPTVIMNRRGRSQDKASEDRENMPPPASECA